MIENILKMSLPTSSMRISWKIFICFFLIFSCYTIGISDAQGDGSESPPAGDGAPPPPEVPKEQENCNGIFLSYTFQGRKKLYPRVKNVSAQPWSFQATATIANMGADELKSWKMHIGFNHEELLVSVDGAVVMDGDSYPIRVGKNGTVLAGFPKTDLKTAIDTAGDYTQMQTEVKIKGTLFGMKASSIPMPKTIKLINEGFKCPAPAAKESSMHVCCMKDPKYKAKNVTTKFLPRQYGDLSFTYDVLQAYENKYTAQVTIDNNHPLGRLDHWNLTWEWMRNEFIYSMRGAYTRKKDPSACIYGAQGKYYKDFDFSTVQNCETNPIISDLPPEKENDEKVGKLPFCCRNGTILPKVMNETKSKSIFQMEVFKLPPDLNRTALSPPQKWKISGRVNPTYKCGPPIRVDPSEFPDPSGLSSTTSAVASWQVTCNITKPEPKKAKCCVSFSAFYADSVVPCNTCACGCEETSKCNANASPLPLPPDALLVPFDNRTEKAKAWFNLKNKGKKLPKKLPCPDNCGVSINWHVDTDFKSGWTARLTLFNWDESPFDNWFTAIQMKKGYEGFENVYSFNGTKLPKAENLEKIIFMQGLPGLNYLVGEVNGTHPATDPRVPGKQQSVISFLKKHPFNNINVAAGAGFPSKVFFNGEECSIPKQLPKRSGATRSQIGVFPAIFVALLTFGLLMDRFH